MRSVKNHDVLRNVFKTILMECGMFIMMGFAFGRMLYGAGFMTWQTMAGLLAGELGGLVFAIIAVGRGFAELEQNS